MKKVPYTVILLLTNDVCRLRAIELTEYYLKALDCDLRELFEIMKSENPILWNKVECKLEQYREEERHPGGKNRRRKAVKLIHKTCEPLDNPTYDLKDLKKIV